MKYENKFHPEPEQIKALLANEDDSPICMINLLKFREKAEYEDGRETTLTGAEAYDLYTQAFREILASHGGDLFFESTGEELILGEVEELWDAALVAEYPSRKAFYEISMSSEATDVRVHRTAGLEGQLNIITRRK